MINWSNEQIKIFETKGNVLISASAGSGKTTVMVKSIVDLLLNETPIENVLVLSYTIASAGDMRAKIIDNLFESVQVNADNVEKIRKQIDNISFADICTVDSFCNRIVRENFEEIDIDPSFELMNEEETEYKRRCIAKEVLLKEYLSGDDAFLKFMHRLSSVGDDSALIDLILKLYNIIYINPSPKQFIENISNSVGFDENIFRDFLLGHYKNLACHFKANLEKAVIGADFSGSKNYQIVVEALFNNLDIVLNVKNLNKLNFAVNSFMSTSMKGGRYNHTLDQSSQNTIIAIRDMFKKYIEKDIADNFIPIGDYDIDEARLIVDKLLLLVQRFKTKYDIFKDTENKRDFLDLSIYAIKLLDNEKKAKEIALSFDYIFIDEYQDINPLHEVILQKVAKADNMFMVGDSKQSIYAFRNADTQIFLNKIKLFNEKPNCGTNLKLTQNFRSQRKILEFVDHLFKTIMTEDSCGLDYLNDSTFINTNTNFGSKNMATVGDDVEIKLYSVLKDESEIKLNGIYSVKNHKEELTAETATAYYEGLGIAEKIKKLINIIDDKGENKYKYSDMAILFRKRSKNAQTVLRAIRDSGIPYVSSGFDGGYGNEVKKTLINLVRVIDNPHIDIAFAGYLLSYFGGFNENEVLKIHQLSKADNKKQSLYFEAVSVSKGNFGYLSEKCKKALLNLERWRTISFYKNVSSLLNEIVAESGYDAYILSQFAGKAEHHFMSNFISSINEEARKSLHSFLMYYDNMQTREQFGPLDFGNAVKVLTIHGSKGLEFPIVFVSQINDSVTGRTIKDDVIVDRDIGVGTMVFDKKTRAKYPSYAYNAIQLNAKRRTVAENIRLFYVALTRAKDKMFISGTATEKNIEDKTLCPEPIMFSNSFLDLLFYSASKDDGIKLMLNNPVKCSAIAREIEVNPPVVFNKAEPIYLNSIDKVLNYKYKHIGATKIRPKYSVTELNKINDDTAFELSYLVPSVDSRVRGIAYHKVMENIDLKLKTYNEVDYSIKNMIEKGILLPEEAESIDISEIVDCLKSDFIANALKGDVIEREKSFMLNLPACEVMETSVTDNVLIQGTIDMVVFGKENMVIDFKSSVKMDSDLKKLYGKQLELYALAVEVSFGIKVDKKYIYSFRERKGIEL